MKAYLLIDRSGSMSGNWAETSGAVAAYVQGLDKDMKVHAAVFDGAEGLQYEVVHNGKAGKFEPRRLPQPRGMTPLYDALGQLAAKIEKDGKKKAQIVILTDGFENASREVTMPAAKKIIKRWEKKGYDIVWLGASFEDVDAQAVALGVKSNKVVNMATSATYGETMSFASTRAASYAAGETSADDALEKELTDAAGGKS